MNVSSTVGLPKVPHSSVFKLMWFCQYLIPREKNFKDRVEIFKENKAVQTLT